MPPAYEVLLLNTAIPQIQAAQSGDTYLVPRDIAFSTVANLANGTNLLPSLTFSSDTNTGIYREGADALGFTAGGGTNQMVLTSTGLGIGTNNPAYKLHVVNDTAATNTAVDVLALTQSSTGTADSGLGAGILFNSERPTGGAIIKRGAIYGVAGTDPDDDGALTFYTLSDTGPSGFTEKMRLDSSGNLGLGVTPSAWNGIYKVIQIDVGSIYSSSSYNNVGVGANVFYNAANSPRYISSDYATLYGQDDGLHAWYTAPSGTAGAAISFTQAMTLDASGNLGIGETNPGARLHVDSGSTGNYAIFKSTNANGGYAAFYSSSTVQGDIGTAAQIVSGGAATDFGVNARGSRNLIFGTNNTERARITSGGIFQVSSGGSVQVGGTAARATTAGTNRLDIFNGTAPVGTLTDGISIYSSSGEAYVMDAAGNATLFSPHDAETNEWIFKSKHTPTGKVLKIDVERLLKFVNDHFGLDAVHEFVEK